MGGRLQSQPGCKAWIPRMCFTLQTSPSSRLPLTSPATLISLRFSGLVGLVSFPVPKPAAVAYLGTCQMCGVSGSPQMAEWNLPSSQLPWPFTPALSLSSQVCGDPPPQLPSHTCPPLPPLPRGLGLPLPHLGGSRRKTAYVALSVSASASWQWKGHRLALLPEPCSWRGRRLVARASGDPASSSRCPPRLASGWTAVWGSAGRHVPLPAHHPWATGRREMTLTLVSSLILLTLKVLQHVGLVRSERCGVLAE